MKPINPISNYFLGIKPIADHNCREFHLTPVLTLGHRKSKVVKWGIALAIEWGIWAIVFWVAKSN